MKTIPVRFLLKFGSFLDVILPERAALAYLQEFQKKELPTRIGDSNPPLGGCCWSLDTDQIMGIHTAATTIPTPSPTDGPKIWSGYRA